MELTAVVLRWICCIRSILLLATLITQLEYPAALGACELTQFPMTNKQLQLCEQYPELVSSLATYAVNIFKQQCRQQFKYERWDCTNVTPPIFGAKQSSFLNLQTKEAAFVYALVSATVVHTIADHCVKYSNMLHYCGCEKSLKDKDLVHGEKWAGCSPDMNFSINFTKEFLDEREDNVTLQYRTFVSHNNKLGRLIVMDYMYKVCTCIGSGTRGCSRQKVCKVTLPTMNEVARKLKMKYEHSMIIPASTPQNVLAVVERGNHQKVNPRDMIYFNHSPDYCVANPDYNIAGIAGRECTLKNRSFSQHCDNLCCNHGYETFTHSVTKPCNCKFVWCCHVECSYCHTDEIRHKCRNKFEPAEVSSTTTDYVDITNTTWID